MKKLDEVRDVQGSGFMALGIRDSGSAAQEVRV